MVKPLKSVVFVFTLTITSPTAVDYSLSYQFRLMSTFIYEYKLNIQTMHKKSAYSVFILYVEKATT